MRHMAPLQRSGTRPRANRNWPGMPEFTQQLHLLIKACILGAKLTLKFNRQRPTRMGVGNHVEIPCVSTIYVLISQHQAYKRSINSWLPMQHRTRLRTLALAHQDTEINGLGHSASESSLKVPNPTIHLPPHLSKR